MSVYPARQTCDGLAKHLRKIFVLGNSSGQIRVVRSDTGDVFQNVLNFESVCRMLYGVRTRTLYSAYSIKRCRKGVLWGFSCGFGCFFLMFFISKIRKG